VYFLVKIAFAYDFAMVVFAIPFKVLFRAVPETECFFDLFVAPNGVTTTVLYCVFDRVVRAA
jgi:hypothetical protein